MSAKAGPNGDPIFLFIIFVVKCKERLFGGYVKKITKVMLWDVRGILVVIVQVVNTNMLSLEKELKVMMILPLKNIFYSAITHLILKTSQFLLPIITTFKLS